MIKIFLAIVLFLFSSLWAAFFTLKNALAYDVQVRMLYVNETGVKELRIPRDSCMHGGVALKSGEIMTFSFKKRKCFLKMIQINDLQIDSVDPFRVFTIQQEASVFESERNYQIYEDEGRVLIELIR